jgi:membrane protease YdiL (CAAX protease family)
MSSPVVEERAFQLATVFLIVAVGSVVLGALLAPLAYEVLVSVFGQDKFRYSRVFHRAAMVCAAGLLYYFRRELKLGELVAQLRAAPFRLSLARIVLGAGISLLASLAVLPFVVTGMPLQWQSRDLFAAALWIGGVVPGAIIVSLIEETFFRGILFLQLRARLGVWGAGFASSLLYAVVHFMTPVGQWRYPGYSPWVGLEYLGAVFGRMTAPATEAGIMGLFLVGAVLCAVLHRGALLSICIGLHTGWVIAVKVSFYFTAVAPGYEFPAGVGRRYFLVAQPLTWLSIVAVGAVVLFLWLPRIRRSAA